MAKRIANKQLTDRNWNEQEETEEAGVFVQASQEIIKKREIKIGRRKNPPTESGEGGGAFKGFSGFTGLNSKNTTSSNSAPPASLFNFGPSSSKGFGGLSNGNAAPSTLGGGLESSGGSGIKGILKQPDGKAPSNGSSNKDNPEFLAKLGVLNQSVSKWIKQHVDKNPYCILSPVFSDYERHVRDLEKRYPSNEPEKSSEEKSPVKQEKAAAPAIGFQFPTTSVSSSVDTRETSSVETSSDSSTTASSSVNIFGKSSTTGGSISTSTATSSGLGTFSGFNFKPNPATVGFQFASSGPSKPSEGGDDKKNDEDEEYVPPKAETTEFKEDGAFYTKKCKLFYNKDNAYTERGVGMISLKPAGEDSEKTQLIIRADNTIGTILLNIILNKSFPVGKQGKNNVSIVCIPNPPIFKDVSKPVPMLIRVKTSDDADELVDAINKHM